MALDSPDGEYTREQDAKRRAGDGDARVPGAGPPVVARGRPVAANPGPPFRGTFVEDKVHDEGLEHMPESNLPVREAAAKANSVRVPDPVANFAIGSLQAVIDRCATTQPQRDKLYAAIDVLDKM